MTDGGPRFLQTHDQALSSGGSHLGMLAPQSEALPGQVSSSLFGRLKARGGSVRDLHLHLHAADPTTVAAVVWPRGPCGPPFIHFCFPTLPQGSVPVVPYAKGPFGREQCGGRGWGCGGGKCVLEDWVTQWMRWLVTGHAASLAH